MSVFALVGLCLKHPVCLWLSCRTFPSVGRRKLFLPLVHFTAKWFISIAASYRFHAPEFHSPQVCPTPSSLFTLSQGRNTPQRGRVGMGRDRFLAGRGNGFKSILLYHYLISLTSDYWRNIVGLLQCTVFSQCQWSLQRAVECILRRGKKADWEKSSIFILISLTQETWTPALMLLNVGGMLNICHLLYSKDAFASSALWDGREQIIFSS